MINKKKVFVFPAGTEIGLEICRALKYNKHFELWGGNSDSNNHAPYVYPNYYDKELPLIINDNFIEEMQNATQGFDFIYPASDDAVLELARNRAKFDCEIIAPGYGTCEICRSKATTYRTFDSILSTPKIYSTNINELENNDFPLYLKPDRGQGSENNHIAYNYTDLNFYMRKDKSLLSMEYLQGIEVTVDCFTDRNGVKRFVGARERKRIKSGISTRAIRIDSFIFHDVDEFAAKINLVLSMRGAWFFQIRHGWLDNIFDANRCMEGWKLLEVAPRIAGTSGYWRSQGINLPALTLYDRMGLDIEIIDNKLNIESDRALQAKYKIDYDYDTVYVDLDDCLIIDGKINTYLVAFLSQCRNEGKGIVVITRSVSGYEFFSFIDNMILIRPDEKKSDYMTSKKAIFIDDSFGERKEVHDKLGIPVFDVDGVEALLE